jgi:hypothetical protein
MSKEHSGGQPQIAVEWRGNPDDGPVAIRWENFNFEDLDSIDDIIRERHARGNSATPIIEEVIRQHEMAIRAETVNKMLGFIIGSESPGLSSYALAFTCQIGFVENLNPAEVARRCGVSKQAVYQAVDRACNELGLRKTQWMRDQEAKDKMSKANYRARKSK